MIVTAYAIDFCLRFPRIASPKGAKTGTFIFSRRFWDLGPCPGPSTGFEVQFPVKIVDLDAYVSSYRTFRQILRNAYSLAPEGVKKQHFICFGSLTFKS